MGEDGYGRNAGEGVRLGINRILLVQRIIYIGSLYINFLYMCLLPLTVVNLLIVDDGWLKVRFVV